MMGPVLEVGRRGGWTVRLPRLVVWEATLTRCDCLKPRLRGDTSSEQRRAKTPQPFSTLPRRAASRLADALWTAGSCGEAGH